MEETEKSVCEVVLEKAEDKMNEIMNNEGITRESVDYLYKLVDIHKDLKNEKYWKEKEEKLDEIRKL